MVVVGNYKQTEMLGKTKGITEYWQQLLLIVIQLNKFEMCCYLMMVT